MQEKVLSRYSFIRLVVVWLIVMSASTANAQSSSFTYQGRLTDGGTAANGNYDLQFALWDSASGGAQIGSTLTLSSVAVSNGVFSVSLDFGAGSFNGANRFLEISARPISGGAFTVLTPRQPVTATPYAIRSLNAATADSATNATNATTATNATQLGGVAANQYIQTNDARLSDSRPPLAGSSNYIQSNSGGAQSANFNISGNGTLGGTLSAAQFNIGNNRVVAISGGASPGTVNSNSFVGVGAGAANTPGANTLDGNDNSFFGSSAGNKNTTGDDNSFFGTAAGSKNTFGAFNSFFGSFAGVSLTGGNLNAFFGQGAGGQTTSGSNNSFFGGSAGSSQLSGSGNSAFGAQASVTTGLTNATAIGAGALVRQSNSLVLGSINGEGVGTADTNVGIGTTQPAKRLEVGTNAVGDGINLFGIAPGYFLTNGGEMSALGLAGSAGLYSTDALKDDVVLRATNRLLLQHGSGGAGLILTATGTVVIPNLGAASSNQATLCRNTSSEIAFCNSSSLRYKSKVVNFAGGLNIISRLRPISFTWKADGAEDIGFGAEEVEKVAPLFTFRNAKGEIEGVRYDRLGVLFVNAFKEQQTQIKTQQEQIKRQQTQMTEQQAALAAQQQKLDALEKLICRNHRNARACRAR